MSKIARKLMMASAKNSASESGFSFFAESSSIGTSTVDVPSGVVDGDVAVLFDVAAAGSNGSTPSGWQTVVRDTSLIKVNIRYKILSSSDAGNTISGATLSQYSVMQMLVFRFSSPVTSVSVHSLNDSGVDSGNPPPQTINVESVGAPVLLFAMTRSSGGMPSIEEVWPTETFTLAGNLNFMKVYYETQNTISEDRAVTTTDGNNYLSSTYSFALSATA